MLLLYYVNTKSDILIVDHYTRRPRLRRSAMGKQLNHIYSSLHTHTHTHTRAEGDAKKCRKGKCGGR